MKHPRLALAAVFAAPLLLAWAATAILFGAASPAGGSYDGASDGYVSVLASYAIMFSIATWVGGGFVWLTLKLAKARAND